MTPQQINTEKWGNNPTWQRNDRTGRKKREKGKPRFLAPLSLDETEKFTFTRNAAQRRVISLFYFCSLSRLRAKRGSLKISSRRGRLIGLQQEHLLNFNWITPVSLAVTGCRPHIDVFFFLKKEIPSDTKNKETGLRSKTKLRKKSS